MQTCCTDSALALAFQDLAAAVDDLGNDVASLAHSVAALEQRQAQGAFLAYEPVGLVGSDPNTRFGTRAVKWARLTRHLLASEIGPMHLLDDLIFAL